MPQLRRASEFGRLRIRVVDRQGGRVSTADVLLWRAEDYPGGDPLPWDGGRLPDGEYVVAAFDPVHGGALRRFSLRADRIRTIRLRLDRRAGAPKQPS